MNKDYKVSQKSEDKLNRYDFAKKLVEHLLTSFSSGQESLVIGINGILSIPATTLIDCLIIYPEALTSFDKFELDLNKKQKISDFKGFYKLGVKLPIIEK